MAKTVAIGIQSFAEIIEGNYFYIDKTNFIKEWWESGDSVTLITRPRRFGKTLNVSMIEQFFSVDYADREDLFEGLSIWNEEKYKKLQGTYPVISLSFARVKEINYISTRDKICQIIRNLYIKNIFLKESDVLTNADRQYFERILSEDVKDSDMTSSLYQLSDYLSRYYGKKVIILLDEYDTPMQEAYVYGFWEELVAFTRSLFNSTFKTNPFMARSVMTGITRVSKESIFSDLNNLNVVTTTSDEYATAFGFTEKEVFKVLDEYGYGDKKDEVKRWYDGFIFGSYKDIYNPWSILNFLDKGKFDTYWANSSSNSLAGKLIREGNRRIKTTFESLLNGEVISCPIDEQIVYDQLDNSSVAIWSLLLASGYLKVVSRESEEELISGYPKYELMLTNLEVKRMFERMIYSWFNGPDESYNDFVEAMLSDDLEAMNVFMNRMALQSFSYFDTGNGPSVDEPERFYHGFVLGLMVDLAADYVIKSNRESGFGRYDIMIEPKDKKKTAIIIEFKVFNKRRESSLEDTVKSALDQIEEKGYAADLIAEGFKEDNIRKYGFAFEGKKVLIG